MAANRLTWPVLLAVSNVGICQELRVIDYEVLRGPCASVYREVPGDITCCYPSCGSGEGPEWEASCDYPGYDCVDTLDRIFSAGAWAGPLDDSAAFTFFSVEWFAPDLRFRTQAQTRNSTFDFWGGGPPPFTSAANVDIRVTCQLFPTEIGQSGPSLIRITSGGVGSVVDSAPHIEADANMSFLIERSDGSEIFSRVFAGETMSEELTNFCFEMEIGETVEIRASLDASLITTSYISGLYWEEAGAVANLIMEVDPYAGRVGWSGMGQYLPAKDVTIRAYWMDASDNVHVIPVDGQLTKTNENGYFCLPAELTSHPLGGFQKRRGVFATYNYYEHPFGIASIQNFPDGDPKIGSLPTDSFKDLDELVDNLGAFNFSIRMPFPVVFQPGVWGSGYSSAAGLRDFLTDSSATNFDKRHDASAGRQPIPAYPFFGMPSEQADGVPWGYNNGLFDVVPPEFADRVMVDNAVRLHNYLAERVQVELAKYVGEPGGFLPFFLVAHSYGGLVTRKWMLMNRDGSILLEPGVQALQLEEPLRYVSLDATQGGTEFFGKYLDAWSMLTERNMNGCAPIGMAPAEAQQGWNHWNILGPLSGRYLFIGDDVNQLISPWPSAMGVGRTMLPTERRPNGHCQRFLGGYEVGTSLGDHSIQGHPEVYEAVARFITRNTLPELGGVFSRVSSAVLPLDYDQCTHWPEEGAGTSTEGVLNLAQGVTSSAAMRSVGTIGPYEPGTMRVIGRLTGAGASIDVLDESGMALPKANEVTEDLGGAVFVSFDVSPGVGQGEEFGLVAGPTEDASFSGSFVHLGRPELEVWPGKQVNNVGEPVIAFARVVTEGDQTLTDLVPLAFDATLTGAGTYETTLADDGVGADIVAGDGTYSGEFSAVNLPGSYRLGVWFDGSSASAGVMRRRMTEALRVCAQDASVVSFQGTALNDVDSNGLAEELIVNLQVSASVVRAYRCFANLEGASGASVPLSTSIDVETVPANPVVALAVPAESVHETGGGPYTLRDVTLTDLAGNKSYHAFGDVQLGSFDTALFEPLAGPLVAVVEPDHGAAGTTVYLWGEHLDGVSEVTFGSKRAQFDVLADDGLRVRAPLILRPRTPALNGDPGTNTAGPLVVNVKVKSPNGEHVVVNGYSYHR